MKPFSDIMRKARLKKSWTAAQLAKASGIPAPTISRIESGKLGASLLYVILASQGLGLGLVEVASELGVKGAEPYIPAVGHVKRAGRGMGVAIWPTITEVRKFVLKLKKQPDSSGAYRLLSLRDDNSKAKDNIDQFREAYKRGAVITLQDVSDFIYYLRVEQGVTLAQLENITSITDSRLSRIETQATPSIKLADIVSLDLGLRQSGKLFGMFWAAGLFELWCQGKNVFGKEIVEPLKRPLTPQERQQTIGAIGLYRLGDTVENFLQELSEISAQFGGDADKQWLSMDVD